MKYKKKVSILTGASGFLGQVYIHALHQLGYKIIITDIDKVKLYNLYKKLKKKNMTFTIIH